MKFPRVVGRNIYHDVTNNNGSRLVELCCASNMRVVQSFFPHREGWLWTFEHPSGKRVQLEHILISGKWLKSVRNCRAYSTVEIASDHRILSMNLKISLRSRKTWGKNRPRFNWGKLLNCKVSQTKFALSITNRFKALDTSDDDTPTKQSVQEVYDSVVKTVTDSAQEILGKRPKRSYYRETSIETTLIARRNRAKCQYQQYKTSKLKQTWCDLPAQVTQSHRLDQERYLNRQLRELKTAKVQNSPRHMWQIAKGISGQSQPNPASQVKGLDGNNVQWSAKLLEEWRRYLRADFKISQTSCATLKSCHISNFFVWKALVNYQ